ncbi:type 2 isopentenyl-diphosphate Delta-isomerase [bacterium (Candidatus Blackallbacteria) CG17_big_fil_post_rev_8_21_14_2_50_48_46]|uniref:Isopentenyl-diphosphate delta-isomerase n=1 Tax=bacterium (Candidatus Blackallbacteria) CG17_big_fil_post_rev_8_21_14_2_50_48_46 TaxID=2014261 RepID=A0A2M7G8Y0_9BACT|nr:MAG: type 2 isopentenyl-diphosphate Delta-isomerase [bacterium (Candidatus Blackallbacteria) CG18_big_fil_WC_8_21_14_2_50_49_26]PIW18553.1 MAG: type 2 isopentenyl-diphosphate Delta-isomerase [bacterium (Candidatus Blackallbacteria) CG17_big_fil_post_rev_8_21_14_2_50_48_46]PIW46462.1 MAG: type 2 isopentenyl-diphosphate Delta-isomerase [bacterium (Candidatus Blackallbacteria) CG13_big_fil_rev_8_21_14_2_50_49_14]
MADESLRQRKLDHISIALGPRSQFSQPAGFEFYQFIHQGLPELDLAEIDLSCTFLGKNLKAPLLISSMTGGPAQGGEINHHLALAAQNTGIGMGVGSQRIMLVDPSAQASFQVRDRAPDILLLGNLGAVQLNDGFDVSHCRAAVEGIGADGLYLHLNPLQEAIQPEGDTNFSGLWPQIEALCQHLPFPVLLKECGCGLSGDLAARAVQAGIAALEISGAGGTSWALIESQRSLEPMRRQLGETFADWGIPTPISLQLCREAAPSMPLIASGGVRNGLDAAKALAMGADLVSVARPFLQAATESAAAVEARIQLFLMELRVAMFCVGAKNLAELRGKPLFRI